ncbi:hypothetical protein C0993_003506 [Termitomyces sp. T159_Od127]|nr:hypothetical protein C0993_003506 [Termitomyces sp. T159_Od127]
MSTTDATAPSVRAISIRSVEWKHDKFSRNSLTVNFSKWSKALEIHLSLLGLKFYVFLTQISCPSSLTKPVAYANWVSNDDLARAVILTALNDSKYEGLDETKTAASLYRRVKARAEGEGPVCMVTLMQEVLKIQCSPNESLTVTAKKICNTVHRIFAIKALDEDLFKCAILLNSLSSPQYKPIQAQVSKGLADATAAAPYTSDNIQKLMETMQNLMSLKSSSTGLSTDTALAATVKGRWRSQKPWLPGHTHHARTKCCTTCVAHGRPCGGHEAPFCAHPGGAMAKQGFEAAQNAAHAANPVPSTQTDKGKNATGTAKMYTQLKGPGRKVYLVEDSDLGKLQTLSTAQALAGFASLTTNDVPTEVLSTPDEIEWEGWMVIVEEEELQVSVD